MYGERRNAIREYVQNAYDSLMSAVQQKVHAKGGGKVVLTVDRDQKKLVIWDNGLGLSKRVARRYLDRRGSFTKGTWQRGWVSRHWASRRHCIQ